MVQAGATLVERLRALQVWELMDSDQRASCEPHHVMERTGVFIDDRIGAEQTLIPRTAAGEVAHCERDVRDRRELGHHASFMKCLWRIAGPTSLLAPRIVRSAELQSSFKQRDQVQTRPNGSNPGGRTRR